MKTRAAVLRTAGEPWRITELDLDEPKANEVLVRMEAAGLCHSDEHIRRTGTARLPTSTSKGLESKGLENAERHPRPHRYRHDGRPA
jgi:S-(hydroxymethyl)glutathione dehydrogenase/alcohol dehydrogenase